MKTKKRTAKRSSTKKPGFTIVVVALLDYKDDLPLIMSGRSQGDWAAFVGTDRDAVVAHARTARDKWTAAGIYGPYHLYVGTLTGVVSLPVSYKVVAL